MPKTMAVQSWRESTSGGKRRKEVEYQSRNTEAVPLQLNVEAVL
jgi:hypothetical protein